MEIRGARWSDLEQVAELLGAQSRAASGAAGIRLEQVRRDWKLPGFALGEDNLIATANGRVAAYGAVMPDFRLVLAAGDAAVADELLERVCARARARGDRRLTVAVSAPVSSLGALVERHRFELQSETLLMWRDLAEPVEAREPPPGIEIRTFEPGDAGAVHALLDEAYLGWDARYVPVAHEIWSTGMTNDPEFDASVWWLAERYGELAGCALHWSSGWLKDLAVRDSERGRGLGAALIGRGLAEFARRGVHRVGLKVDATNPTGAVALYERLGFVTASRDAVWALSL
jgi:ribosomal protein S18 acetylase RimI-like enzyme